ncbi:hypothetical protein HanRHA438_Chr10g0475651 [Helianthus annuus]|nr:hypothetical protein HanIR_Chr10g0499091 [Helianthus annuus]KAJ0881567.1 hypothetical protein HanRHA438_Chr10g0475651 [Helianthus annuus]
MVPLSLLLEKSMWVSFGFQCLGMKLVRLVLERVRVVKDFILEVIMRMPEDLMVSPEMVRSVRLEKRLRKTPVRCWRELMEVKDRRLVVREVGKWTMGVWQSRKVREVRVEREERAVVERERSSEQLVRRRERRWRKGVALSQVVALWGGWVQGSWVVGMYKDWRALSCFGSRVVEGGDRVVVVVV